MQIGIDTSGDAQIMQLLSFASCAFGASSLAFYWVDPMREMREFRTHGLPDDFIDRYKAGMNHFDPLVIRRLAKSKTPGRVAGRRGAPPVLCADLYRLPQRPTTSSTISNSSSGMKTAPLGGSACCATAAIPRCRRPRSMSAPCRNTSSSNLLMHPRQREARVGSDSLRAVPSDPARDRDRLAVVRRSLQR